MSRQLELLEKPTRSKPRALMHVCDAGCGPGSGHWAEFECKRCGHRSKWQRVESVTEAKRGIPCPKCNASRDCAIAEPPISGEGVNPQEA